MIAEDEKWMQECLRLARRGAGFVSPNPMVGCVIVKHGRSVGRGYHRKFGWAHAEREALKQAGASARGATLYVNLEPCSHYGKTPPCVDAVVQAGVRVVVVGTRDPNPLVTGRGIVALRRAGIRVRTGIREKESRELNEAFFKYIQSQVPFVTLKLAQTLDGKIASKNGQSRWITSREARIRVHRLRAEHDAVLVGAGTVLADDPQLTVRLIDGRNPIRVVIDGLLRSPIDARVFRSGRKTRTLLFASERVVRSKRDKVARLQSRGVEVVPLSARSGLINLKDVLGELGRRNIASVLVEGGQQIFTQFVRHRLADKAWVFTAPKILGEGIATVGNLGLSRVDQSRLLRRCSLEIVGPDILVVGYFS